MACRLDTPLRVSGGVAWTRVRPAAGSLVNIPRRRVAGCHTVAWSVVISYQSTPPATDTEAELAAASIELDPEAAELEAEAALIVEEPAPVPAAPAAKDEDADPE